MIFFRRFDTGDKQLTYLQRILTKLLKEIDMIGAPFSHFPPLRFIAPEMSGYKSFLQTHQELWAFLKVSKRLALSVIYCGSSYELPWYLEKFDLLNNNNLLLGGTVQSQEHICTERAA